jgi:exopolysaccharide biosynthesis polyprenyl glycosylphosphotransferase
MESRSAYAKSHAVSFIHTTRLPLAVSKRKILLVIVDLVIINEMLLLGMNLNFGSPLSLSTILLRPVWFATLTTVWLVIASAIDNYDLRRTAKAWDSAVGVVKAAAFTGITYLLLPLVSPPLPVARFPLLVLWAIGTSLLIIWRIAYATACTQPNFQRRALIIGAGSAGQTAARVIAEYDSGYKVVGFVDDDDVKRSTLVESIPVVGEGKDLIALVQFHHISDVVLAITNDMPATLVRSVLKCYEHGIRIVPMAELFEEITERIPVKHLGPQWVVSLPISRDVNGLYPVIKRLMDIGVSAIGLLLLIPFVPLIAAAIKLDSAGPVFYRPERLGRAGKSFRVWKFRTMVIEADRIGDPTFTKKNDSRITRLGQFLRTTHVDELPQFINILKGEMSIVGPRPERHLPELEAQIPFYRTRYAVRPGTAGWALVKQGYADGVEDTMVKLEYDLYYIKHLSLSLDIRILIKTITTIVSLRGR